MEVRRAAGRVKGLKVPWRRSGSQPSSAHVKNPPSSPASSWPLHTSVHPLRSLGWVKVGQGHLTKAVVESLDTTLDWKVVPRHIMGRRNPNL